MWFFAVVTVASAVLVVLARRRAGGSWTAYRTVTGAALVWVLLGTSGLVSFVVALREGSGQGSLATSLFVGGLIGTALVQVYLLRRSGFTGSRD